MSTWKEMANSAFSAAKKLQDGKHGSVEPRSSISRAYYAAYCAITHCLPKTSFAHGWSNPAHAQLRVLITTIPNLSRSNQLELRRQINFLRLLREDADYRPRTTSDAALALNCLHRAASIMKITGVLG